MNRTKLHIVPHEGQWAIRLAGEEEPAAVHSTQQAAIEDAMDRALDDELDIVVHRQNGTFRKIINFETLERRAEADRAASSWLTGRLAWGLFAAGAVSALAVYLALHPPVQVRRFYIKHRP